MSVQLMKWCSLASDVEGTNTEFSRIKDQEQLEAASLKRVLEADGEVESRKKFKSYLAKALPRTALHLYRRPGVEGGGAFWSGFASIPCLRTWPTTLPRPRFV